MIENQVLAQKKLQVYAKDPQNQPIRNIKIIINGKQSVTTGSQGENSIKIFREGKIQTIRLESNSWALVDWEFIAPNKLIVRAEKSFLLKGRLVTPQNIPVPEVNIWLTDIRGISPAITNEQGFFVLSLPQSYEKKIKDVDDNTQIFQEKMLVFSPQTLGGLATATLKKNDISKPKNDSIFYFVLSEIILKYDDLKNITGDQNLISIEEQKQMMGAEKQYFVLEKQNLEKQKNVLVERLKQNIPEQTKKLINTELEKIEKKLSDNKKSIAITQEKNDRAINELMEIVSETEKNHEKTQAELSETKNQKDNVENAHQLVQITLTFVIIGLLVLLIFIVVLIFTVKKIKKQRQQLAEQVDEIRITNNILKKSADILDKKNQEIFAQKDELEKSNEKIMDSIRYALSIQQAILPQRATIQPYIKDDILWYQPRDIVSGDFYWFSQMNNYLFFAVADCTGHGVPGAFMTVMANTLLNQIVNENEEIQPHKILSLLHQKIQNNINAQNSRDGDGLDIGLLRIDTQTKKALYGGAKVPLYCFLDNHCTMFKATNFSIGSTLRAEKTIEEYEIPLTGREIFYMMSDGWQDQLGGDTLPRKKFMKTKVIELLQIYHVLPFDKQKEVYMKAFQDWRVYNDQTDDVLLWGISLK